MQAGNSKSLRIGLTVLAVLGAAVLSAAFASSAKAGATAIGTDLQQINVPYLNWRGGETRLVKCFPTPTAGVGTFTIEDWSGDPAFRPQFSASEAASVDAGDASTTAGFIGMGPEQGGRNCYAADLVSQKAGLAVVKLKVQAGGRVIAEHQFLAGWMSIQQTNVEDIGPRSVPASTAALDESPCDPAVVGDVVVGNCDVEATPATTAAAQNQVQVTVTGTIPMLNNFDEVNAQLGRAAQTPLVLPRDWAALAGVMARSSIGGFERGALLWDIHDEFTGVPAVNGAYTVAPPAHGGDLDDPSDAGPTHQDGGICNGDSTTMDEVDNCLGDFARIQALFAAAGIPLPAFHPLAQLSEFGAFSRFLHGWATGMLDMTTIGTGNPTIGPYDPLRNDTYLPNGTVDEGDAPMPTARVDVLLNGDGMLVPIDKHVIYSRNGSGSPQTVDPDPDVAGDEFIDYPSNAHNLWAPFYGRFIPATTAEEALGKTASGEDGGAPNDFHSYLTRGLYHYWDFAVALERSGAVVTCPPFEPGVPASEAFGINEVTVYTDEHGETRVGFNGGVGFSVFPAANENGACDLQAAGINPGSTLGTATISAIARYPHQPITAADVPGDEVIPKTITSLFAKTLTCVRKTNDLTQALWICTATATGIAGGAFENELVCFSTTGERILPFPEGTPTESPAGAGPAVICVRTDEDGVAQVEVIGKGQFNVVAEFTDENIFRRFDIAGSPLSGATGGNPGTGGVGGTGGTPATPPASPPPATAPALGNNPTINPPTVNKPAVQARVMSARLVDTKTGRKLALRIKSTKKTAKVRIVLKTRAGKTLATAVRTVRTNRVVMVPNLRIVRGATRISVSVLR